MIMIIMTVKSIVNHSQIHSQITYVLSYYTLRPLFASCTLKGMSLEPTKSDVIVSFTPRTLQILTGIHLTQL